MICQPVASWRLAAFVALTVMSIWLSAPLRAHAVPPTPSMPELTLDELMNLEVTTVSKKSQPMSSTASAVFVITQEDIRRSGHTTIPEILRLAPGLHVARSDASGWEISARGFNGGFANKLLVLIDGRSVYTPLFSGVYWDIQDLPLEDIERIEVIRGPGASIWGANAVNGVINIIRKKPEDQLGTYAHVLAGSETQFITNFGHAATLGDDVAFRISGRHNQSDSTVNANGRESDDEHRLETVGGRLDWHASDRDLWTVQGDWYSGISGVPTRYDTSLTNTFTVRNDESRVKGGNTLVRWTHEFSETSSSELQLYWDHRSRHSGYLKEQRNTYDASFHHRFQLSDKHDLIWGAGARHMRDRLQNSFNIAFTPNKNEEAIYNFFVQDDWQIHPEFLLTFGSKFEWNSYTSWEIQPTLRGVYTPHANHTFWGAISRAARTPSRAEREGVVLFGVVPPPPAASPVLFNGNSSYDAEYLTAYELGYRTKPFEQVTLDIAAFYNDYENALELIQGASPTILSPANGEEHFAYGVEAVGNWQVRDGWRLQGSYTGFHLEDTTATNRRAPAHQFQLHSYLSLPHGLEFDTGVYYQGRTRRGLSDLERIGSHWRWDVRLAWHPRPGLELSLVVQDLLDDRHEEAFDLFQQFSFSRTQIQRNVYAQIKVDF